MKEKEVERLNELKRIEYEIYMQGVRSIAGIDEAGRGSLAGPVVVACAIMKKDSMIEGVNDSKKISEKKREKLYYVILEESIAFDQKEGILVVRNLSQKRPERSDVLVHHPFTVCVKIVIEPRPGIPHHRVYPRLDREIDPLVLECKLFVVKNVPDIRHV